MLVGILSRVVASELGASRVGSVVAVTTAAGRRAVVAFLEISWSDVSVCAGADGCDRDGFACYRLVPVLVGPDVRRRAALPVRFGTFPGFDFLVVGRWLVTEEAAGPATASVEEEDCAKEDEESDGAEDASCNGSDG